MTISASKTRNKFSKQQRLCSKKSIEALFQGGDGRKSVSAFPLRAVFEASEKEECECDEIKILVSVSKRRLHHAVDRNRAKRQIREAWRLNRDILPQNHKFNIAFLWQADSPQETQLISRKMRNLLHRIAEMLPHQSS